MAAVGNTLVIGAPQDDATGISSGAAYLFRFNSLTNTGALVTQLIVPDSALQGGGFGASVAMANGKILVSSFDAVHLFDANAGQYLRTFLNPAPEFGGNDGFGSSVAFVGDNVLVAAPGEDTFAEQSGAAYLFDGFNAGLLATFHHPDPKWADNFGDSVAAMGNDILIGAVGYYSPAPYAGAAFLFSGTAPYDPIPTRDFHDILPDGSYPVWEVKALGNNVLIGTRAPEHELHRSVRRLYWRFAAPVSCWRDTTCQHIATPGGNILIADDNSGAAYLYDGLTYDLLKTLPFPVGGSSGTATPLPRWERRARRFLTATESSICWTPAQRWTRTTTDASGNYSFSVDSPGTYQVRQMVQQGYRQTLPADNGLYSVPVTSAEIVNNATIAGGDFGNAWSSPPVAYADSYSVPAGDRLTVSASGVLANDWPSPDSLVAVKDGGPAHGTLALQADGSFIYAPAAGYSGADSFTYKANDGLADSSVATVTINVTPTTSSSYTASPGTKIKDNFAVTSQLAIADSYLVRDLNVQVKVTHGSLSDLKLELIAPDGTTIMLCNYRDLKGTNLTNTIFDDEAPVAITAGSAPYSGRYRPVQPLSSLDGEDIKGTWKLRISDNVKNGKTGTFNSWTLTVLHDAAAQGQAGKTGGPVGTLVDAALVNSLTSSAKKVELSSARQTPPDPSDLPMPSLELFPPMTLPHSPPRDTASVDLVLTAWEPLEDVTDRQSHRGIAESVAASRTRGQSPPYCAVAIGTHSAWRDDV